MQKRSKRRYKSHYPIRSRNKSFLSKIKNVFSSVLEAFKSLDLTRLDFKNLSSTQLKNLNIVVSALFGLMILGFFAVVLVFALVSRQLPNPDQLLERSFELSTRFYDRNNNLIYEVFGDKNRTLVTFDAVSPDIVHATLATEDAEFYLHHGYSLRGMARALKNTITGEGLQGGSTLTQQVIKNTLLSQERTVIRKLKEFILSLQLENRYSKDEIIQMYLNESPYGGQNYGVYSASKAYFNKNPNELTIAEAAYVAGLPQSPSAYSQFGPTPEKGIERKNYVLYLMNERGWIGPDSNRYYLSDEDYEAAKTEELHFETARVPLEAPHFIFYAKQYVADLLGEDAVESGGLKVKTTLDLETQKLAQEIVTEEIEANQESLNVWNGAMVVLNPETGGILAMVGSKGYNTDPQPEGCISGAAGDEGCKFDPYLNVTLAKRQPGSAIKPITYATMLEQGYTAAFPFLDVPTTFSGSAPDKPYVPVNYDGLYRGVVPLRKSLANSLNIPAVKALQIVGIDNMINQAEKMGISTFTDRERYGLALTLGGGETKLLELTGAFSVFAANGTYRKPTPLIEVRDSQDNLLYKQQDSGTKALSKETSFLISDILSDDGARSAVFGLGSLLKIPGHSVAVKTGTTDDKRDNYAIGYTPFVVAGVWVGNNNNEMMNPYVASGISGASPIWNKFMTKYLADKEEVAFEAPENVEKMEVDELTGGLPYEDFAKRYEWFTKGTEPTARSDWFQKIEVCKDDGRIANEDCREADRTDTKNFIRITAELPEWQNSVDAWVKENYDDDKYFPPLMKSQLEFDGDEVKNKDDVHVSIVGLSKEQTVPLKFRLNVETSAYNDIKKIRIYMDNDKVAEDEKEPYGYNFELSSSQIGSHTFEVVAEDEDGNKGSDDIRLNVVGY